jgi:hypothetical protein
MRGGGIGHSWLRYALCLCLVSSVARADEDELAEAGTTANAPKRQPVEAEAQPLSDATFAGQEESRLVPADSMTRTPTNWAGDLPTRQRPAYIDERLKLHRSFVRPFVNPSIFPEFSANLLNFGGWNPRSSSGDATQLAYLSFYLFEIYAPGLTLRSADTVSPNRFRMNLKIPVILPHKQAVALIVSGQIPTTGAWTANGAFSTYVGYAIGGEVASAQLRVGFGVDQLIGETVVDTPIATSVLGDITAGIWMGKHARLVAEIDARRLVGRSGAVVRAWPGVRFYPLELPTLSIGVGGFYWADSFITPTDVGKMRTRQAGASIDLGYLFF